MFVLLQPRRRRQSVTLAAPENFLIDQAPADRWYGGDFRRRFVRDLNLNGMVDVGISRGNLGSRNNRERGPLPPQCRHSVRSLYRGFPFGSRSGNALRYYRQCLYASNHGQQPAFPLCLSPRAMLATIFLPVARTRSAVCCCRCE